MPLLPLLLFVLAGAVPSGVAVAQSDEALQKVVILSRHGVRSSLHSAAEMANWSRDSWPAWGVPEGDLTPRGAELATQMGRYYRQYLNAQGAMPAEGCPAGGSVYIYADVMQRTRVTAQSLINGMARDCGITVRSRGDVKLDALFHPLQAGVCKLDPMVAQTRVLERAGGNINGLTRDLKAPFAMLQSALGCCKPALCTAFGKGETCTLPDLPTALLPAADGSHLGMLGGLAIASTSAELILLEYADGKPLPEVGWGRATPPQMTQMFRLHTEYFDLTERTPYLARKMGSSLLTKIAAAVTSARSLGFGPPEPAVRDARFVAYVGHDTNIVNLAGMLDTTWLQPGYQRNQTPPAGALMFEVREGADKKLRVYTSYVAQSMEQMRNVTLLSLDAPPFKTPLRLPGCGAATTPGFPCTLEEFAVAVRNVIDRDCVE
ncbi:MAG: histidine-type phosphatase [Betaproteobacteria bacterium]